MSHFWADWDPVTHNPQIIRRDTRIYWSPQSGMTKGNCVGTFFGENPGSGQASSGLRHVGHDAIIDRIRKPGDPTLRLILDIWQLAIRHGKPTPKDDDFIEVLNTYYFRNGTSGASLIAWRSCGGASIHNPPPSSNSQFAILGWGVGHSLTPEASAAVSLLAAHPRIIIPDSKARITVMPGHSLGTSTLVSAPAAPSYILMRSKLLLPIYKTSVANAL